MLVNVRRRTELLDAAVVEHCEAVAHRERLFLVVRDVDEGDLQVALQRLQEDLHLLAQLEVERAERLVEQEHRRRVDNGARERDALPLASGELGRPAAADVGETDALEHVVRLRPALALRHAADAQPVFHVLEHGHVREERVVLEHGVHVALRRRDASDVDAGELDVAGVRPLEAGYDAQRRRLAGSGRAEHREELPGCDVEVDAIDRNHVAVGTPDPGEANRGCGGRVGSLRPTKGLRRQVLPRESRARVRARRRSPTAAAGGG